MEFSQNNVAVVARRFMKENYYMHMKKAVSSFCCALFGKCDNSISKEGFKTWQRLSRTRNHEQATRTEHGNMAHPTDLLDWFRNNSNFIIT
ncbi:hypothetical protein EOD39_1787 [Acipenser ruthenus]|uniref:Uncharacterized protein n=1 Tax=Acipenser ruthenus TaxID=7906 RepID=A0A444U7L1_ACIRT|nr:hypothetical protein EOD39_1787 [Acipenser ruthenus]